MEPGAAGRRQAETGEDRARAWAILDLDEGRGPVPVLDSDGIRKLLGTIHRIAIVGASPREDRPSNDVMRYLLEVGYDCVPINPLADVVLGVAAYPSLMAAVEATGPIDLVDVFRRADSCPEHAREAVAVGARCLWLQLGIVSWEAAMIAAEGGLAVVMNRCTKIEHRMLSRG